MLLATEIRAARHPIGPRPYVALAILARWPLRVGPSSALAVASAIQKPRNEVVSFQVVGRMCSVGLAYFLDLPAGPHVDDRWHGNFGLFPATPLNLDPRSVFLGCIQYRIDRRFVPLHFTWAARAFLGSICSNEAPPYLHLGHSVCTTHRLALPTGP
jgi:hypothetical protein